MSENVCGPCAVSPYQEPASSIPGNIGIVRAKVMIWENDPFQARPHQITSYPFSNLSSDQSTEDSPGVEWILNSAYLKPVFTPWHMLIATDNIAKPYGRDLLGDAGCATGKIASAYIQAGYSDHELWMHIGNIFANGNIKHPSKYINPSGEGADTQLNFVQWNYVQHIENGTKVFWPEQITKHGSAYPVPSVPPAQSTPVIQYMPGPIHWTLEKHTPMFQGQDFFISVEINKQPDELTDPGESMSLSEDVALGSEIDDYKYLMYDNADPPSSPSEWIPGISNAAFYIPPDPSAPGATISTNMESSRKQYWWKYKSYILIEIGVNNTSHHYFIELVKGRNPRFLHLGEIWDNPKRATGGSIDSKESPEDWHFIKQCRELSSYSHVSCDDLFTKGKFRISVRNHLGRIVIIFEGHEGDPWVIQRQDNVPHKYAFEQDIVPMVVPADTLRLHGGNLPCTINYTPMTYIPTGTVYFRDRQADTGGASNKDLWMTFSHQSGGYQYQNPSKMRSIFNDPRLNKLGKESYDCDAYTVREIHSNAARYLKLYEIFSLQYKTYGKGYLSDPIVKESVVAGNTRKVTISNGLDPRVGGVQHKLEIFNAKQSDRPFIFGISSTDHSNYPYKDMVSQWDVGIQFTAGSVALDENFVLENAVTPIATSWRLIVLGGEKPTRNANGSYKVEPFDVACLTTKLSDGWTAEGYNAIKHEAKVQCYIPLDPPVGDNVALYRLGQRLLSLHNKSFYVTIAYWWDNGIGQRDAIGNSIPRLPPENNDLLIQMTGIAYGASISRSVNKIFMDFTVQDYMSVLEKQFIFNSPFFDSVADVEAIYELAKMAGFDDTSVRTPRVNRQPLGYLQYVIENGNRIANGRFTYNGEVSRCPSYDLPGSYASLQQPAVKFQNGETYQSAMNKISQLATKSLYFDRWGVLRFEVPPAIDAAFYLSGDRAGFHSVFDFVTSPFYFKVADMQVFKFDPCQHAAHLVYDVVQYSRSVEDCVDQIVILTASNDIPMADGTSADAGFIVAGYTFFEQIWNPESEGFFGFRKPMYQSNGVFGGLQGVRQAMQNYAKKKYPPATIQFSTYGIPGLKALDIITLDDNMFYITEIAHDIDPSQNNWTMNITGEWLKPFTGDLGFLSERSDETSNSPQ